MIFSFFAIFSKSFWSSGWWILPADEDPACSRVDTEDLFFVFRDFPVAAEEPGCELSMIFSCRPENENNSKFAQYIAFWIAFSLLFFQNHFGVQDDGYYLRISTCGYYLVLSCLTGAHLLRLGDNHFLCLHLALDLACSLIVMSNSFAVSLGDVPVSEKEVLCKLNKRVRSSPLLFLIYQLGGGGLKSSLRRYRNFWLGFQVWY